MLERIAKLAGLPADTFREALSKRPGANPHD